MNQTFAMIKPTAVKNKLHGEILARIIKEDFKIRRLETKQLSKLEAQCIYQEHKGKDFFNDLIAFVTSGPVVIMKLVTNSTEPCFKRWRTLMGATDPKDAKEGTIRKKFAKSRRENAVHGSDSQQSAEKEIAIFWK